MFFLAYLFFQYCQNVVFLLTSLEICQQSETSSIFNCFTSRYLTLIMVFFEKEDIISAWLLIEMDNFNTHTLLKEKIEVLSTDVLTWWCDTTYQRFGADISFVFLFCRESFFITGRLLKMQTCYIIDLKITIQTKQNKSKNYCSPWLRREPCCSDKSSPIVQNINANKQIYKCHRWTKISISTPLTYLNLSVYSIIVSYGL